MIDPRIKFRHLQCFLAVAEHKSLVKAADFLAVTQPAVSKTIKELEEVLEARLFERGRKGAALTREAETFFEYAKASISALQQGAQAVTRSRRSGQQLITIGTWPSLTGSFLPEALQEFRKRNGNMKISVITGTTDQLMTQLRDRAFDLALCRNAEPEEMLGLSYEYLYVDPLVAMVRPGHPLLCAGSISPRDLESYTAILPIKGSINRHVADTFAAESGIRLTEDFIENLSVTFGRSYAVNSDAIWYVPWGAVKYDAAAGSLAKLFSITGFGGSKALTGYAIGLMTRTNTALTPPLQALINAIRDVAFQYRAVAPQAEGTPSGST